MAFGIIMNIFSEQTVKLFPSLARKFLLPSNASVNLISEQFHSGKRVCSHPSLDTKLKTSEQEVEPDKLYKLIELEMRANQPAVLKSYATFADMAAKELNITIGKSWSPRKADHTRYTVLRSAHVHKRCRVQYEVRTYFHFMHFHRLTGSTADTFLEYIERNLPEGVGLKVTKVALERIPEHLIPPHE